MNDLICAGFSNKAVKEPMPSDEILNSVPEMKAMFLIISAVKETKNSFEIMGKRCFYNVGTPFRLLTLIFKLLSVNYLL